MRASRTSTVPAVRAKSDRPWRSESPRIHWVKRMPPGRKSLDQETRIPGPRVTPRAVYFRPIRCLVDQEMIDVTNESPAARGWPLSLVHRSRDCDVPASRRPRPRLAIPGRPEGRTTVFPVSLKILSMTMPAGIVVRIAPSYDTANDDGLRIGWTRGWAPAKTTACHGARDGESQAGEGSTAPRCAGRGIWVPRWAATWSDIGGVGPG